MKFRRLKTLAILALASIATLPATAQDLLARQAPIDRKMKAVDSVALHQLILNEQAETPAADLYEDWNNHYAHRATALPDTFKINLRGFCMPTDNRVVTSNFGARWGRQHKGIDVKVYIGDTIRAAFSGKVRMVKYEAGGYGKYVVIRHGNGLETIYGHMSKHLVAEDEIVEAGQPIGLGGNTGRSTGSHLHFETRLCGVALNPALMFDFKNQDVTGDFYTYRRSTNERESVQATKMRGRNDQHGYTREDVQGSKKAATVSKAPAAPTAETKEKPTASNKAETRWYKVGNGDTVESVAEKNGISVETLCRLNRIGRYSKLTSGSLLKCS